MIDSPIRALATVPALLCALTLHASPFLPEVTQPLGDFDVMVGTAAVTIDLSEHFGLPSVEGRVLQVATTLGAFNIELLEDDAPDTVANFLNYIDQGVYRNVIWHRSVPGLVIQTGGFRGDFGLPAVPKDDPIPNEFGVSNTRGTLAMAKLAGDPDSATNEWFINLADNSADLDIENGGFTVFARVLGSGMQVADAIASVARFNAGGPFSSLPLRNILPGQSVVYPQNCIRIFDITELPVYPGPSGGRALLRFEVESSNPRGALASVQGNLLTLSNVRSETTLTLRAVDANGNAAESSLSVRPLRSGLAILSPRANTRLADADVTFTGTVSHGAGEPDIEVTTDGGTSWQPATVSGTESPYSWAIDVTLQPGLSTVFVRSTSPGGEPPLLASRAVSHFPEGLLEVVPPDPTEGRLPPPFTGTTNRLVGQTYTVTTTPVIGRTEANPGMYFLQWLANGVPISTNPSLTFVMEDGLVLEPEFIVNPFPPLAGNYNGIGQAPFELSNSREEAFASAAFANLTLRPDGVFSGTLRLQGLNLRLAGRFDGFGHAEISIPRRGAPPVLVSLAIDFGVPGVIDLQIVNDGRLIPMDMARAEFTGRPGDAHPLAGRRFNMFFNSDWAHLGSPYATVVIAPNGTGRLLGKTVDNAPVSFSSVLVPGQFVESWELPVFAGMYRAGSGLFWGKLVFNEDVTFGIEGTLAWYRPALPRTNFFPDGFLTVLSPIGGTYSVTPGESLITGDDTAARFRMVLDRLGSLFNEPLEAGGDWPASNRPTLDQPAPFGVRLTFNATTGLFRGSMRINFSGRTINTPIEGTFMPIPASVSFPADSSTSVDVFGGGYLGANDIAGEFLVISP